jgi:hypothetical protein
MRYKFAKRKCWNSEKCLKRQSLNSKADQKELKQQEQWWASLSFEV